MLRLLSFFKGYKSILHLRLHYFYYSFAIIMIHIYKASLSDAASLTEFSRIVYQQHYLHLWHAGGAEWYMQEYAYNAHKILNELSDSNIEYFIAAENGQYLGYLKIILKVAFAENETKAALEVERIYLQKSAMGRGLGRKFMELALHRAQKLKKDTIFLKAMDSSSDAIQFYKKLGYTVSDSLQLPMPEFSLMKKEFRGMVILKKSVIV